MHKVKFVLQENEKAWKKLLPLTYFRPISHIRIGSLTIREAWEKALGQKVYVQPLDIHKELFYEEIPDDDYTISIDSRLLPTKDAVDFIVSDIERGESILLNGEPIITYGCCLDDFNESKEISDVPSDIKLISHPSDIIRFLEEFLFPVDVDRLGDFEKFNSADGVVWGNVQNLYVAKDVKIDPCFIDTSDGPVVIDEGATIMQGAMIKGPAYIGPHSVVKMGAKIYGPVALGPYCKVGGEVSHSIFQGYSNKAHDGFIGHAFISEWVNIGADTNNSNLKNTYGPVKMWDYAEKRFIDTGMQFLGLIMGDHAKAGINTMFNTGTVVGVSANVFGTGFPRTFIPSFAWGGAQGFTTYNVERALDTARRMMARRKVDLTPEYERLFRKVFELSQWERWWENKNK